MCIGFMCEYQNTIKSKIGNGLVKTITYCIEWIKQWHGSRNACLCQLNILAYITIVS